MAKESFKYGNLDVVVDDVGEGEAPWDPRGEPRHKYKIVVKGPGGNRYTTEGYGSTQDWDTGKKSHQSLAWNVVNELYSAAMDPDEWITLVIGESAGREALERGKIAEKVIRAAKKFDADDLQAAYEKTQEEGA